MKHLISTVELRNLIDHQRHLVLSKEYLLSPSAKDLAKELGITITWEDSFTSLCPIYDQDQPPSPSSSSSQLSIQPQSKVPQFADPLPLTSRDPISVTEEEIKRVVVKVLSEVMKPVCDHPKMLHIVGEQTVITPFDQAPPGQKIGMTDVITARDANLAAGFMTFEHSSMPWHLTYDEIDYVIEGEFVLRVEDKEYRCKPGDVLSIPKGTSVIFSSPTKAKVFYVTYPANWSDLS